MHKKVFLCNHFNFQFICVVGATISERKVHTIELLTQLEDENLLAIIESLLTSVQQGDWADALTEKEHADIAEGLSDLDADNIESFDSFNTRMTAKYP